MNTNDQYSVLLTISALILWIVGIMKLFSFQIDGLLYFSVGTLCISDGAKWSGIYDHEKLTRIPKRSMGDKI
jgi:hypothetical protein